MSRWWEVQTVDLLITYYQPIITSLSSYFKVCDDVKSGLEITRLACQAVSTNFRFTMRDVQMVGCEDGAMQLRRQQPPAIATRTQLYEMAAELDTDGVVAAPSSDTPLTHVRNEGHGSPHTPNEDLDLTIDISDDSETEDIVSASAKDVVPARLQSLQIW